MKQRKSLWRDARRWLPGVLISAVALFAVFRLASWQDLGLAFSTIRPANLGAALVLTLISLGTRALAWRVLLERKTTFRQAFFMVNEGYLLNNLFPLRAGEFGRAVFMGRATGLGSLHVLSTIVIERAFDMAMAAGLLLATLPLALGMAWARPVAVLTLALVVLGLAALYLMARYNQQVQAWLSQLGKRWPLVEKHLLPRLGSLLNGLRVLTRPSQFLQSLFWIAASWVLWIIIYYLMLLPIAPQARLWWAAFADSVLALGIAIPSAPGALGVFEAAMVGALTLLGVPASAALAYAIMMHFLQFTVTAILGFWGLAQERRSLSTLFAEISAGE